MNMVFTSHHSHDSGTLMILGVCRGSRWAVWSVRQCSDSLGWRCNGRALAIRWAAQNFSSQLNGWFDDCFTYFQRQFWLRAHKGSPLSDHFIWWRRGTFLALLCGKVCVDSALEKLKRKTHDSFSVLVGGVEILAECKTWVSDLVSQQCCGIASVELQKNKVSRSPL